MVCSHFFQGSLELAVDTKFYWKNTEQSMDKEHFIYFQSVSVLAGLHASSYHYCHQEAELSRCAHERDSNSVY